jgi:hypothetical protein
MVEKVVWERVNKALPASEQLAGIFDAVLTSYPDGNKPHAPKQHRPEVFIGLRMSGDGWGKFLGTVGRILTNDVLNSPMAACTDPALRDKWQKRRRVFWGDWTSEAGQLLAAVQPRSRTGVNTHLVLTNKNLRAVYVQRRRGSLSKLGQATELGWTCSLSQLASLRDHPGIEGNCYEFGFADGSWAVLSVSPKQEFRKHFEHLLDNRS